MTGEIKLMSKIMAEGGGEREESRGVRRYAERRMASNLRKKGSVDLAVEGSRGRRWNSSSVTRSGKAERKRVMSDDSASETVGVGWVVMRVRVRGQWVWESSNAASRRKGVRWPMPALGKRTT